jgi:hypothetical protein
VRDVIIGYTSRLRRTDGTTAEFTSQAARGETVILDPLEEARLDASGALAAIGQTVSDMNAELAEIKDTYIRERQSIASVS